MLSETTSGHSPDRLLAADSPEAKPEDSVLSDDRWRMESGKPPALVEGLEARLDRFHGLELAVLFGSRARGTNRPDSDLDVLVDLRMDDLPALGRHLAAHTDLVVDTVPIVVAVRSRDFWEAVTRDGIVVIDSRGRWNRMVERTWAGHTPVVHGELTEAEEKAVDFLLWRDREVRRRERRNELEWIDVVAGGEPFVDVSGCLPRGGARPVPGWRHYLREGT